MAPDTVGTKQGGDAMTNSQILDGNDRDAGVVEEICGYLTDIPPRNYFLFAGLVLVKHEHWWKFYVALLV